MKEIWRDIKGYEGDYQVSNTGKVRSARGDRADCWRELKPSMSVLDTARVTLYKNGRGKPSAIGRLVAATFLQVNIKDYIVKFRDGNTKNTSLDNLCLFPKHSLPHERIELSEEYVANRQDLPGEKWEMIEEFNGRYAVSNMGRIKNLWQSGKRNPIMHQATFQKGYKAVIIQFEGKVYMRLVHRLVAYYFCEKPMDFHEHSNRYYQVNHIDENPSNNRAENLEWCTCKYNCNYGHHNEKIAEALGMKVWQYDLNGNFIREYISIRAAARAIGKTDAENRIRMCLEDDNPATISYGCYWRKPNQPLKLIHGVEQYDTTGRLVAKYKTMADAARATDAKLASICRVAKGMQKTSVGYIWKRAMVNPTECGRRTFQSPPQQLSLF